MKFVRFDDNVTGVLLDSGNVLDLVGSLEGFATTNPDESQLLSRLFPTGGSGSWVPLIEGWDKARVALDALVARALDDPSGLVTKPLDAVRLRAPLASPSASRIFALGTNFAEHTAQASQKLGTEDPNSPDKPRGIVGGFFVVPGTVCGHDDVVTPPAFVQKFDYEVEATVVLASSGRDVAASDVRVWGVTVVNDLSIRDPHLGLSDGVDRATGWPYFLQKNFDGGHPCGPCVVVDEGLDPNDLHVQSRVNGEVRQDGRTSQMISSFAERAELISRFMTLVPGDMITSGSPAGTAIEQGMDGPYLQAGDVVEVEVEGVGILRNTIGPVG